jgi:hypothetical protein
VQGKIDSGEKTRAKETVSEDWDWPRPIKCMRTREKAEEIGIDWSKTRKRDEETDCDWWKREIVAEIRVKRQEGRNAPTRAVEGIVQLRQPHQRREGGDPDG